MPAIEATGWSRFVDLFRGDMEAVRDVAGVFLEESEGQAEDMKAALAAEDTDTVRRVAHSLQSTARQLGGLELASVAADMESAGRQQDLERARRLAPRLFDLLQDVRSELRHRLE